MVIKRQGQTPTTQADSTGGVTTRQPSGAVDDHGEAVPQVPDEVVGAACVLYVNRPKAGERAGGRRLPKAVATLPAQRAAAPCGCSYQELGGTPTFDILPLNEAGANSATGQRVALLQEYMGYIQRVGRDKRGSWSPERARRPRHSGAGLPRRRTRWGRTWRSAVPPTPSTSGRQTVGDAGRSRKESGA